MIIPHRVAVLNKAILIISRAGTYSIKKDTSTRLLNFIAIHFFEVKVLIVASLLNQEYRHGVAIACPGV